MAWVDATAAAENATINLRAYWVATRKAAEVGIWCNRTHKGNLANKINSYKVRNNDNITQIVEVKALPEPPFLSIPDMDVLRTSGTEARNNNMEQIIPG